MEHTDTGWRCLVAHYDSRGNPRPQCIKCSCGVYVQPNEWDNHQKEKMMEASKPNEFVLSTEQEPTIELTESDIVMANEKEYHRLCVEVPILKRKIKVLRRSVRQQQEFIERNGRFPRRDLKDLSQDITDFTQDMGYELSAIGKRLDLVLVCLGLILGGVIYLILK